MGSRLSRSRRTSTPSKRRLPSNPRIDSGHIEGVLSISSPIIPNPSDIIADVVVHPEIVGLTNALQNIAIAEDDLNKEAQRHRGDLAVARAEVSTVLDHVHASSNQGKLLFLFDFFGLRNYL